MSIDDIQAKAADWLAREDRGLTAAEAQEFIEWIGAATMNEVCYLRLQATWERADRLAALNSPALQEFAPVHQQSNWRRPVGALAAAAVILVAVFYSYPRETSGKTYGTTIGEVQSLRLEDGTRVELNSHTRIRAEISDRSRSITLESGEAYFEVVHDARRPFTVYAGAKRITDIGTKFSVYRNGDDVRVIVKEGRVQIAVVGAPPARVPLSAGSGDVVVMKGAESLVSAKPERAILNELSWRSGILVFDQQTLAHAAEEFNRYNAKQVVVADDVRDMKIGGRFRANNVDSFIFLLHRGFGLKVDDHGTSVLVSR